MRLATKRAIKIFHVYRLDDSLIAVYQQACMATVYRMFGPYHTYIEAREKSNLTTRPNQLRIHYRGYVFIFLWADIKSRYGESFLFFVINLLKPASR